MARSGSTLNTSMAFAAPSSPPAQRPHRYGLPIATASARQTPLAISTPEAEAYALMLCVRAVLCVRRLLSFMLGTSLPVTTIFEDNDAVI